MKHFIESSLKLKVSISVFLILCTSLIFYLYVQMSVNTSLYTAELNQKINTTISLNVTKVDRYTSSMEQKAAGIASGGETLHNLQIHSPHDSLDDQVIRYLVRTFTAFPEAIGGGIWFQPNIFHPDQKYYGPYAYWDNSEVVFTWDLNVEKYDYLNQDWYTLALPANWDTSQKREKKFYWTAPYIDEAGSEATMITVDAFMYDELDNIIGISTVDWSIDGMLVFLETNKIAPGSHYFLIEGNSNIVMTNSIDQTSVFKNASDIPWFQNLINPERGTIKNVPLEVDNIDYQAYYTITQAGMFYGILIPTSVIMAPINKLIVLNALMLLGLAVSLIVIFYIVLLRITNPILRLTKAVDRIAHGELDVELKVWSKDEIGRLTENFNNLTKTLAKQKKEISTHASKLEERVAEKTTELSVVLDTLQVKNEDLEKTQLATTNLMEDLAEEKGAVDRRVSERTEELEKEKAKLLQVTSNMRGSGILLDKDLVVVFTNENANELLGIRGDANHVDVMGKFIEYFGDTMREAFDRCVKGETFVVPEIVSHERVYEISFHHLESRTHGDTEEIGYFISAFDITEAKLLERSKSELVAVASHQLRTPLTAMRGNVEMLVDESYGTLNKEQHELLNDIDVSTIRLITMVNEMLDITKIEKGDLDMDLEKINLKEIIDSVLLDLGDYAERHEFKIVCHPPEKEPIVFGDRIRVRQVLQNLIDNSIKYSRSPGTLDISYVVSENTVETRFKDNGIGVPKAEQAKLFGRFYRASNTAKTTSSGSGLGLYIVKSIAKQLGGDIHFESEEGVGTTFIVTLPTSEVKLA